MQPTRADQNTRSALSEFSMRTAMNRTSHILSAISVCSSYQSFTTFLSSAAVAQWVRGQTMDHREISDESLRPLVDGAFTKNLFGL